MRSTKGPRRKGGGRCLGKVRCGRPRDRGRGSGWPCAGKGHLTQPLPGTAGADSVTPGRTRGQARLLGSGGGAGPGGAGRGMQRPEGPGGGLPALSGALVMRPPASTAATAGARAGRGRALSPTASVMKATWMKSDSQLSTYMNHMAPPAPAARPPAGTGLRARAPATRSHRYRRRVPTPRTVVRRRREQPCPSTAPSRVRTSAARRRGGPTAAAQIGARPRTAGLPRLQGGDGRRCIPGEAGRS